jgi:hypothetical protein
MAAASKSRPAAPHPALHQTRGGSLLPTGRAEGALSVAIRAAGWPFAAIESPSAPRGRGSFTVAESRRCATTVPGTTRNSTSSKGGYGAAVEIGALSVCGGGQHRRRDGRHHLQRVLYEYVEHDNRDRPQGGLDRSPPSRPPELRTRPAPWSANHVLAGSSTNTNAKQHDRRKTPLLTHLTGGPVVTPLPGTHSSAGGRLDPSVANTIRNLRAGEEPGSLRSRGVTAR